MDQEAIQPGDGPFYWTRYTYDMLGRLVSRTDPDFDEATVRHEYVESKTHAYDAKGVHSYVVETRDRDVAARYEPNADATGWLMTLFEYGPFGEVTRGVAADGTEQTMAYDLLGRRIGHTDPDAGATTSAFNAFGELVDVWDAEGRHTHFKYDDLGRLLEVTSDDGTATFRFDEAEHGIDRIAEARSADSVVTRYAYDALARPVTMTWEIEGESYEVGVSYDEFGRLSSVVYPEIPGAGRFAVAYAYDAFGYLSQVTNATDGTLYWRAETRNAAGQLEAEGFGNGLATTRTYYPETGLLERLATADPVSGRTLHVLAYTYDLNRNVASRSEAVSAREETYAYDALNRLARWGASNGGALVNQVAYAYDDLGNLIAEVVEKGPGSDVVYRYGENGAPPHALTSRGADRYAYDGSGRQIGGPGRTVDYNGLDLPRVIEQNGVRTEFAYDVDGARVLKRGGGETVASIPGLYDRRTGNDVRHVYHIVADGRTVAQVTQVQAAPGEPVTSADVAYLHGDLQGTVGWVSDAAGQLSDELRYDPFGRRIDAAIAPLPDERRDGVRLGFTGHEHDDELGLINMKGRMYDPALRRFLTPDPFIEAPLFSQSHNRYSYVWNNPATFVDPTGFQREGEPNGDPLPLDPILGSDDWLSGSGEEPLEVPGETIFITENVVLGKSFYEDEGRFFIWRPGKESPTEVTKHIYWDELDESNRIEDKMRTPAGREQLKRAFGWQWPLKVAGQFYVAALPLAVGLVVAPAPTALSILIAGSTSNGGFEGWGAVAGIGAGFTRGLGPTTSIPTATAANKFAGLTSSEIDSALSSISSRYIYRTPVSVN